MILQLTVTETRSRFYYENIQHLTTFWKNEDSGLSCQRHQLRDLLLQHRLHLQVLQVVCDGGEEASGVCTLERAAAVWESSHDCLIVAEDLQTGQEQGLTLSSWNHHLRRKRIYLQFMMIEFSDNWLLADSSVT